MQLYYIRHGQSVNNAGWDTPNYIESNDPVLTEIGQQQAHILSEYLENNQTITEHKGWDEQNRYGFGITHIYTSLMERAVSTALPTARRLQVPFTAWTDIHETGGIYGREGELKDKGLPGNPHSYFQTNYPELRLPEKLDETGWWQGRPIETEEQAHERAAQVWAELLTRHGDREGQPEARVAFFSHGTFFVHLLCVALDFPFRSASHGLSSWFLLNNCSLSRIAVHGQRLTICYLNRTDHIPSHLITA